jgi:hypothetical protein
MARINLVILVLFGCSSTVETTASPAPYPDALVVAGSSGVGNAEVVEIGGQGVGLVGTGGATLATGGAVGLVGTGGQGLVTGWYQLAWVGRGQRR